MTLKNIENPPGSKALVDPFVNLAAAIMAHAAREARQGNLEAAAWLTSEDAALYCDLLGFDHDRVKTIAKNWNLARNRYEKVTWRLCLSDGVLC